RFSPLSRRWLAFPVLATLLVAWTGCAVQPPTSPIVTSIDSPAFAHTPGAASLLGGLLGGGSSTPSAPQWYVVASQWVEPGTAATVRGSRYTVRFAAGSLAQG